MTSFIASPLPFDAQRRPLGDCTTFPEEDDRTLDRGPQTPLDRRQRAAEREGSGPSHRGGRFNREVDIVTRDVQADIEAFLAHAKTRQLSCRTVETYRQELHAAVQHAIAHSLLFGEGPLTEQLVLQLVKRPLRDGRAPAAATFNHRLSVWRRLAVFALKHLGWSVDPTADIKRRTDRRSLLTRRVLTAGEVQLLIDQASQHDSQMLAVRNATIVAVLFHTGLRVSELVGLEVGQLAELDGAYPRLVGVKRKGDLTQNLPLNAVVAAHLYAWMELRAQLSVRTSATGALFVSRKRHRLSVRAVQHLLTRLTTQANLPVAVHPHLLRHSFATALIDAGAPLTAVQHLMAHARITTTALYLHSDERHARRAVALLTTPIRHESLHTPTSASVASALNRPTYDVRNDGDGREAM